VVAEVSEGEHCQIRLLPKAPGQHLHRHPSQHGVNILQLAHEEVICSKLMKAAGEWQLTHESRLAGLQDGACE